MFDLLRSAFDRKHGDRIKNKSFNINITFAAEGDRELQHLRLTVSANAPLDTELASYETS